ncbi:hypothetical protein Hanom_Chr01g00000121 [Helianthus anomalus]
MWSSFFLYLLICVILRVRVSSESSSSTGYRRDPGHPQWHHSAFQDVKDIVRSDVHHMLHSRAQVIIITHHTTYVRTYVHSC